MGPFRQENLPYKVAERLLFLSTSVLFQFGTSMPQDKKRKNVSASHPAFLSEVLLNASYQSDNAQRDSNKRHREHSG